MSQTGADGEESSDHELLFSLGSALNEHRWSLVAVTGGLLPALVAVFTILGQELQDRGDWAYIGGVVAVIALGTVLQLLSGWAARRATELDLVEADRLRVTLKDALQPVAEMIADMVPMTKTQRTGMLPQVATQAVGALTLIFADVDRARATVYRLNPEGDMHYVSYAGRGEGVQPQPFKRHTTRGESALQMVRSGRDLLVENIDERPPDAKPDSAPPYAGSRSGYKTFITCSITDRSKSYGMVTVDAPRPGGLSNTDMQLVGLMADLLSVAFAIEERGSRPQKGIGGVAGDGIK
jgi:GAF domain-containing protein